MGKAFINESTLTSIANAIRSKNGSQSTYTPSQMATAISNIPTGAQPVPYQLPWNGDGTGTTTVSVTANANSGMGADRIYLIYNDSNHQTVVSTMFGGDSTSITTCKGSWIMVWCEIMNWQYANQVDFFPDYCDGFIGNTFGDTIDSFTMEIPDVDESILLPYCLVFVPYNDSYLSISFEASYQQN